MAGGEGLDPIGRGKGEKRGEKISKRRVLDVKNVTPQSRIT